MSSEGKKTLFYARYSLGHEPLEEGWKKVFHPRPKGDCCIYGFPTRRSFDIWEVKTMGTDARSILGRDFSCSNEATAFQAGKQDEIRTFKTGATRDTEEGKHDYEGYLSPVVLERFAEYMTKHRIQPDGKLRESDNWQMGIPQESYMKSAWRHFMDWWKEHRGLESREGLEDALCGLMFNVMGYLHEILKKNKKVNLTNSGS